MVNWCGASGGQRNEKGRIANSEWRIVKNRVELSFPIRYLAVRYRHSLFGYSLLLETQMFPKPKPQLKPNTYAYESEPMVKPTGFREYDARWLFGTEINLMGVEALGLGLGTLIHELGVRPHVVTGHDFRSYSASIKIALINGLVASGCRVHDIGLAVTPMAYFAQFDLDMPCVAMVTASHNDNGWTGVKMGANRPLTFGPDEMTRLKDIVLNGRYRLRDGGVYAFLDDFRARYIADLTNRPKLKRRLKVVCACGNGTAGAFAPQVLAAVGCEVVPLDCELDHTFPHYNPNTEDLKMLHAMRDAVIANKADVALGFDGDGDRCGVVDNDGEEIFADKVGVMLARDISSRHKNALFVADVKSTGLFATDPVLIKNGARTDYWKTGHSYMKRRVNEIGAIAGFEKSGHFFFNEPFGRGYDDGLIFALAVCDMLDRNPGKSMADLKDALPKTWSSPTMSPHCADEEKYGVVDAVVKHFEAEQKNGGKVAGQPIRDLVTVNGVRVTVEDGTWGLVRASSNKPELVVVVESPVSEARMREMFKSVDAVLRTHKQVGAYNQTI
jgi:phosphomannomutase / phosphoglucomutase